MPRAEAKSFHGAADRRQAVGQPLQRKEDARLLIGKGRFSDDFSLPRQTYAALVRSTHPHAKFTARTDAAKVVPGVLGIFTGGEALAEGIEPLPHAPVPSTKYDMKLTAPDGTKNVFIGPHRLLPPDRTRFVGEALVLVVGETMAAALDGAEAVEIDYEDLPFVTETDYAAEAAASVWDEVPDNVLVDTEFGDKAATDAAFAAAAHVVSAEFNIARVTAVAMEPRACLADYDAASDRYTLWAGSGGAVRQKAELAATIGVPETKLRVLSMDVGGNFGSRNRPYVEFGLVLWAARKLQRPVKFTATRTESFITDYQGRDLVSRVSLALTADGTFLALRADNISNVGAYCTSLSPLGKGSGLITGTYEIPLAHLRARAVFTNTMCTQAYRSSGRPEVNFALERLVDLAALKLGMDRVELRRRNLIPPAHMPYTNAVGAQYDSGTYETNMDLARKIADWDGFAARREAAAQRGKLLGLGLANYVESSIGSPKERAEITVGKNGRTRVVVGTQPSGQGHETSFSQVIADQLGVPVDSVDIVYGDTDIVSVGGGSHSGRSMRHAATVFKVATDRLIERGKRLAALVFGGVAEDVTFDDGVFRIGSRNEVLSMTDLAGAIDKIALPDDLKDGLAIGYTNEMHEPVFPNGCAICEVEVDPETGEVRFTRYATVDDVGRCINPLIVHGQTHGGAAQGIGQAMWELSYVDPKSGQPLAGSLMDYGMPRADNTPTFTTEIAEVLSPTNPLGIKAGGEGGTTPALSVTVSAIVDALSVYGIEHITMPATPFNVWSAIQAAKANHSRKQ
ncbi:MAG TPA: xanthine dehydrogenase family protein molybdopterin-binding subunit [Stellaceae bacterium]|nr:xanthine dehydrogenase family protein molybdopterin-binding subunit [Stellaceae bacterium]